MSISCLIPAYNEGQNIRKVLDVVKDYKKFAEVIVIDDCSKDNTSLIVKEYSQNYPMIKLIQNKINQGKSGAIKIGVKAAREELIVMLDADLIGLTENDIDRLIEPVQKREYASTILDRAGDRTAIWGWTNCARFFGGERALWKEDFLKMDIPQRSGYLLETKMNFYYIENNKKIKTIYCPQLFTVHQYDKMPFMKGVYSYLKMSKQIINTATPLGFVVMFLKVEEEKFSYLYLLHSRAIIFAPITIAVTLINSTLIFLQLNIIRAVKLPRGVVDAYNSTLETLNRYINR